MDRKQLGNIALYGLSAWGAVTLFGVFGLLPLSLLTVMGNSVQTKFEPLPVAEEEYYRMDAAGPASAAASPAPEAPPPPPAKPAKTSGARPGRNAMADASVLQLITTRGDSGGGPRDLWADGESDDADAEGKAGSGGKDEGGGERLREWFPEAFLWRPLVETDANGTAVVPVRVPDQLTTWRVLGLAHTRTGAFAGDLATFDSRLQVYVDPVIPAFLYAGDRIDLPIQVMNTTTGDVRTSITVSSDGALTGSAAGSVSLPAGGSAVQPVSLVATGAGDAHVTAILEGQDAAKREIPVLPRGRPVVGTHGGTVGGQASFAVTAPPEADPRTQELEVRVFPGPLAVLASEVARGGDGSSATSAAYGFSLATHLSELWERTHTDADPDLLRRLQLIAWQRVVRYGRSPDAGTAADLLTGLRGTTGNDQATELALRLERTVIGGQRSDGTWQRTYNGNINGTLVETAYSARCLSADATGARTKAKGAIRRNVARVEDPYTAAVLLASGLVDGDDTALLLKIIEDAAVDAGDGRKTVGVPPGARNPWGSAPTRAEVLAWTVLALPADSAWRGDLVAELMMSYSASWGFGAGGADAVALDAVSAALPGLDKPVDVVLSIDGREVARKKLDPTQPKLPAVLLGMPASVATIKSPLGPTTGTDQVGASLTIDPPVPGLAYTATLRSWVPWSGSERAPGVDVELSAAPMRVGEDSSITLTLAAPSGTSLTIEQGIAAGAVVDEQALDAISDRVTSYDVKSDRVRIVTRTFQPGEIMQVPIVVRPTFAGAFTTTPLAILPNGWEDGRVELAPLEWTVAP